jgi:hypothetical protein
MKKLLMPVIAIIFLAMAACNPPAPAVDTVGQQNKELIKKYIDALFSGDVPSGAAMLADNFKQYGPALADSLDRQQTIDLWNKRWSEQLSSVKYSEAEAIAITLKPETSPNNAGDWVLKWGNIKADYKDGSASINFNIHFAFKVENGKITRIFDYYNVADILTQQGFTFVPPAKKEESKK